LTETQSFKKSLLLENYWTDNGFSSEKAMRSAHQLIIDMLKKNFNRLQYDVESIIDFGCGNLELARQIKLVLSPKIQLYGIESDKERAEHALINAPGAKIWNDNLLNPAGDWWSDIDDWYSLAILMPGRLTEPNIIHNSVDPAILKHDFYDGFHH
jgi:hypothetical protein